MKIAVLSGANLNILERRGAAYGGLSYAELTEKISGYCAEVGAEVEFFVSNSEGELIDCVQNLSADAAIVNFGAYSHYSLALCDALKTLTVPKIEVHLTNIHKTGRHESVTGAACDAVICGLGAEGYRLAVETLARNYKK